MPQVAAGRKLLATRFGRLAFSVPLTVSVNQKICGIATPSKKIFNFGGTFFGYGWYFCTSPAQ